MKCRFLFRLMLSLTVFSIVPLPILAQSEVYLTQRSQNQAQLPANARLTQAQIRQLRSLGIRIVVPSYVPRGFRIASVRAELQPSCPPRFRSQCTQYAIIYRNSANYCFAIESVGDGIGDAVERENHITVDTRILGRTTLYYGRYQDPEMRQTFPESDLYMEWVGSGPFYRFTGAGLVRQTYYGERLSQPVAQCRHNISPQEAAKVIRSFSFL
ncbi:MULTISPECIES: hypothetical protein [Aerosakkonema]|uniref:hypothetical protein n=1 Tax=Aerosakkonema TaxID=1246629 RepID=UPI0035B7ED89